MTGMSPRDVRRLGRVLMLWVPAVEFVLSFLFLLVTYLVLAPIAPNTLGEVAVSPVRFAAWIALVNSPMIFASWLVVSWRGWTAMVVKGELLDPPERKGWRHHLVWVRNRGITVACRVLAALIVFRHVADPGDVQVWQLVAVTAAGPILLSASVAGLFRLLRWWWRRKHSYQPRHARPDEEPAHARTQAE